MFLISCKLVAEKLVYYIRGSSGMPQTTGIWIMLIAAKIIIALVAIIHLYILVMEMFLWTSRGPKVFKSISPDMFEPTKTMAANQGLYNGFLAAGLIWSLLISDPIWQQNVAVFFLACVLVAGLYGAVTVERKILFVQVVPALLGLAAVFLA